MKQKTIFAFLGPSLALKEVSDLTEEICFLPPVKCGDIVRLLRYSPQCIVIIDGYFEQQPAVWHKEILYALSKGVRVIGAASMGALRAAELCEFGMQGVGKIFECYRDQVYEDDDEVAVLHTFENEHYLSLTDAMVNIRETIAAAEKAGIVNPTEATDLVGIAKGLFYKERTIDKACELAILSQQLVAEKAKHFLDWVKKGGFIDQKAIDARAGLDYALRQTSQYSPNFALNDTSLLELLIIKNQINTDSFNLNYQDQFLQEQCLPSLSTEENLACFQRLANILLLIMQLPGRDFAEPEQHFFNPKDLHDYYQASLGDHKFTAKEEEYIITICSRINFIVGFFEPNEQDLADWRIAFDLSLPNASAYPLLKLIASCWKFIEGLLQKIAYQIDEARVIKSIYDFRRKQGLLSSESMKAYFQKKQIREADFLKLMQLLASFSYVIEQRNIDFFAEPIKYPLINPLVITAFLQNNRLKSIN